MVNLKIFTNYYIKQYKVIIKDCSNDLLFDSYLNYLDNLFIFLKVGVYRIFVNNQFKVFYYDGIVKKICFYFGYNTLTFSKKFLLVDKFYNLPYATSGVPIIYYKQTGSDSTHNYDDVLESVILTQVSTIIEVENPPAVSKTFNITDANYSGLNISNSTITLSE